MLDTTAILAGPAQQLAAAGLSVIPVGADKRPQVAWKRYQQQPAGAGELGHWFIPNGKAAAPALAVICGAVSGNLTVLDFDRHGGGDLLYAPWAAMVEARAPGLAAALPRVETPSGGLHVYLRSARCEPNQQLAVDAAGETRIETRGEGGYVVAPPSPGYRTVHGSIRAVPRVSDQEYAILLQCARALSETLTTLPTAPAALPTHQPHGDRPGDAYNARATLHEVASLLCCHGWTAGRAQHDKIPMTRPGKSPREGTSGDVAFINGIPTFTQFSSNGGPFEPRKGYSAFAVYALLEHGGDYPAAARALGGTPAAHASPAATESTQQQQAPAAAVPAFDWRTAGKTLPQIWAMEFPEPRWFVEGIIPAGTSFLFAAPKTGKSLLAWQIALAAASGGVVFGKVRLAARPVVYICFEDGLALVKQRTMRMLEGRNPPTDLTVYEHWRPLGEGGLEDLADYLAEHPGTDFIIDTFEPFRARDRGGNAYREDYAGVRPLAALARAKGSNVLIVYHEAKAERSDSMMTMSGSLGLGGAVDGQVRMVRNRFVDGLVKLQIVARGLPEDLELALQYEKDSGTHTLLGDAEHVVQSRERAAIVDLLRCAGEALGLQAIADRLGKHNLDSVRRTCDRMAEDRQLKKMGKGIYAAEDGAIVPEQLAHDSPDSRTFGQLGQQDSMDTHTHKSTCPTCPSCPKVRDAPWERALPRLWPPLQRRAGAVRPSTAHLPALRHRAAGPGGG